MLDRLASLAGRGPRPSLIVDKHLKIWIGNETDAEVTFNGSELFGFNTGSFEYKIVRGGKRDISGVAWKVSSDMDLVVHEKHPMPICAFMHHCASTLGLGDVAIHEHTIEPKMHPAAASLCKCRDFVLLMDDVRTLAKPAFMFCNSFRILVL